MSSNNFPAQGASFWDFITSLQQANNNNTNNSSQRTETPGDESDNNTHQNADNPAMDWANNPWVQWASRQGGLGSEGFPFGNSGPFGEPRRRGRGRPYGPPYGWPFGPHPGHGPPPPGPPPHPRHEHPHRPHSPHHPHGHPPGPPGPGPHHRDLPHRPHHSHRHHSPGPGGPRNQHVWDNLNNSLGGPPAWLNELGTFIAQHFDVNDTSRQTNAGSATANFHNFTPNVDVFDTEKSYVVHISLAGAKKEDVNVDWDAEKSELVVSGVIYRPGDEEFLKTLALDERKVGAFERRVKLGSSSSPVVIEVDGISAKMEDGVLRVTLPKQEKDDFVEVHHVDVD